MKAAQVAEALKARGIAVQEVTEENEFVDGCVKITKFVHVTVSFFDEKMCVSKIFGACNFVLYQNRPSADIDGIAQDIREALKMHPWTKQEIKNLITL